MRVRGVLLVQPSAPSFEGGIAQVTVEEAGRADAPAVFIAGQRLHGSNHRQGEIDRLPFEFDCPSGEARHWILRATIEVPGGPDLYSSERIDVPTDGAVVTIPVEPTRAVGFEP